MVPLQDFIELKHVQKYIKKLTGVKVSRRVIGKMGFAVCRFSGSRDKRYVRKAEIHDYIRTHSRRRITMPYGTYQSFVSSNRQADNKGTTGNVG